MKTKFLPFVLVISLLTVLLSGCSNATTKRSDEVLAQMQKGDIAQVYADSSQDLKDAIDLDNFTAFVNGSNPLGLNWTKIQSVNWTSMGFYNSVKYCSGEATFEGDKKEIINMQFIEDGDQLKLFAISFGEFNA